MSDAQRIEMPQQQVLRVEARADPVQTPYEPAHRQSPQLLAAHGTSG